MKSHHHNRSAFTLVELLVVVAILFILAAMQSSCPPARKRTPVSQCQVNLKQIYMAWYLYSADNQEKLPADAGSDSPNPVRDRLIHLDSYVGGGGKLFVCPADTRTPSLWITNLVDANVSYFAGLHDSMVTNQSSPCLFLAGDRNLWGGAWSGRQTTFQGTESLFWTNGLHSSEGKGPSGNVLFMDGHVDYLDDKKLKASAPSALKEEQRILVPH